MSVPEEVMRAAATQSNSFSAGSCSTMELVRTERKYLEVDYQNLLSAGDTINTVDVSIYAPDGRVAVAIGDPNPTDTTFTILVLGLAPGKNTLVARMSSVSGIVDLESVDVVVR